MGLLFTDQTVYCLAVPCHRDIIMVSVSRILIVIIQDHGNDMAFQPCSDVNVNAMSNEAGLIHLNPAHVCVRVVYTLRVYIT